MVKPLNGEYFTDADDIAMVQHPQDWPYTVFLPMKRHVDGNYEHGVVLMPDVVNQVWRIWFAYLGESITTETKNVSFDSPEALVAAGWHVD